MSERSLIFDLEGNLVGNYHQGVALCASNKRQLGKYCEDFVYDNEGSVLCKVNNGHVLNIIGEELGYISGHKVYVSGKCIGSFSGSSSAGAASIALFFNIGGVSGL